MKQSTADSIFAERWSFMSKSFFCLDHHYFSRAQNNDVQTFISELERFHKNSIIFFVPPVTLYILRFAAAFD